MLMFWAAKSVHLFSDCGIIFADFYNITFVSPAMGATLQTFLDRSVLMTELFPTLG